jgi:hypothetical protein
MPTEFRGECGRKILEEQTMRKLCAKRFERTLAVKIYIPRFLLGQKRQNGNVFVGGVAVYFPVFARMPFRLYDCQNSTAIRRIAFNKHKNELIIEFHPTSSSPLTAYHYTHIRLPRDEVERALLDYHSLGEYINTQIKPSSRFRQLNSFPTNVRPSRSSIPNYSPEWIAALETRNLQRDHLELMREVLGQCDPRDPPAIPPPSDRNHASHASHAKTESVPRRNPRAPITMQSRYLFGRVICGIAEFLRGEAVRLERERDYAGSSLNWTESYDQLFAFANSHVFIWASGFYESIHEDILILDHFSIDEYFSDPNAPTVIFDMHNIRQLFEFLNGYEILLMDTERHKNTSLQYLLDRAQFVREKLHPMLQSRDIAKEKMGVDRWKNNPNPKFDFAAARREWEEELRRINEGIELLERLNFLGLKTSRH